MAPASPREREGCTWNLPSHAVRAGFRRRTRHEVLSFTRAARPRVAARVCPEGCQAFSAWRLSPARLAVKMEQLIQDPHAHFCRVSGLKMPSDLEGQPQHRCRDRVSTTWGSFQGVAATSPAGLRPSPKVRGSVRCSSEERAWSLLEASTAARSRVKRGAQNKWRGLVIPASGAGSAIRLGLDAFSKESVSAKTRSRVRRSVALRGRSLSAARPRGSRRHRFNDRSCRAGNDHNAFSRPATGARGRTLRSSAHLDRGAICVQARSGLMGRFSGGGLSSVWAS